MIIKTKNFITDCKEIARRQNQFADIFFSENSEPLSSKGKKATNVILRGSAQRIELLCQMLVENAEKDNIVEQQNLLNKTIRSEG